MLGKLKSLGDLALKATGLKSPGNASGETTKGKREGTSMSANKLQNFTNPYSANNNAQPTTGTGKATIGVDASGNPAIVAPPTSAPVEQTQQTQGVQVKHDAHVQAFRHEQNQQQLAANSLVLAQNVTADLAKEVGGSIGQITNFADLFNFNQASPVDSLVQVSAQNNTPQNEQGRKLAFQKRIVQDLFKVIEDYLRDVNSNNQLRFEQTDPQDSGRKVDTLPQVFTYSVIQAIQNPNIHQEVKTLLVDKLASLAIKKQTSATANIVLQQRYNAVSHPVSNKTIQATQGSNKPVNAAQRGEAWKAIDVIEQSSPETVGFVFGIADSFPWDRLSQEQKNAIDEILLRVFNHPDAANKLIQFNITKLEQKAKHDGFWSGGLEPTLDPSEVAKLQRTKNMVTTAMQNPQSAIAQGKQANSAAVKLIGLIDSTLAAKAPQNNGTAPATTPVTAQTTNTPAGNLVQMPVNNNQNPYTT